jgi:hypothetical protein
MVPEAEKGIKRQVLPVFWPFVRRGTGAIADKD